MCVCTVGNYPKYLRFEILRFKYLRHISLKISLLTYFFYCCEVMIHLNYLVGKGNVFN